MLNMAAKKIARRRSTKKEPIVVKDNELIMASYTLSVEEQRLVLACINKAQENKIALKGGALEINLTVQDYVNLYDVKMKTAYKALNDASERLINRTIRMEEDGKKRAINWLQEKCEYDNGKVTLLFTNLISRHIVDMVNAKNAYRIRQATQLRSQHGVRIFEILNSLIDSDTLEAEWEVGIDEYKDLLDLEYKYDRWVDLKKYAIEVPVAQINKCTSMKVNWEVAAKVGKKIDRIRFTAFESNQLTLGLK